MISEEYQYYVIRCNIFSIHKDRYGDDRYGYDSAMTTAKEIAEFITDKGIDVTIVPHGNTFELRGHRFTLVLEMLEMRKRRRKLQLYLTDKLERITYVLPVLDVEGYNTVLSKVCDTITNEEYSNYYYFKNRNGNITLED